MVPIAGGTCRARLAQMHEGDHVYLYPFGTGQAADRVAAKTDHGGKAQSIGQLIGPEQMVQPRLEFPRFGHLNQCVKPKH